MVNLGKKKPLYKLTNCRSPTLQTAMLTEACASYRAAMPNAAAPAVSMAGAQHVEAVVTHTRQSRQIKTAQRLLIQVQALLLLSHFSSGGILQLVLR